MPFLPKTSINKLTNDIQVRFIFTEKIVQMFLPNEHRMFGLKYNFVGENKTVLSSDEFIK